MSALENVFGKGVKIDALGNPIERGIGNLGDQAKAVNTKAAQIILAAHAEAAKILAAAKAGLEPEKVVSQTVAAQAAAATAAAPAPATVAPEASPNVAAEPPAAAAVSTPPVAAPVVEPPAPAATHPSLLEKVRAALAHGEANLEEEIEDIVKDM